MVLLGGTTVWRSVHRLSFEPTSLSAEMNDELNSALMRPRFRLSDSMTTEQIGEVLAERLDPISPAQIPYLAEHILDLAHHYRFDPAFILSMIQVESGFRTQIISSAGAVGLMQLMPATAGVVFRDLVLPLTDVQLASLKHVRNPLWIVPQKILMDPFTNLTLGVAYLAFLREHYRGLNPYYLISAYNMGPAKLDELLSKKTFKPVKTKSYFEAIRRAVFDFRSMTRLEKMQTNLHLRGGRV
jgi:soluble lytic murein transglycosylase-like protein